MAIKQSELFDILKVVANFAMMAVNGRGVIETATSQVRTIFGKNEGEIEGLRLDALIPELSGLGKEGFTPIQPRGGLDLMGDDEVETCECQWLEYLAARELHTGHFEVRTTIDGEPRLLEIATYKLMHDGEIIFTVLISDVTKINELKAAEAVALERARQSSAEAKAKSEFLANMSHEIRTPMNGVLGMAELLKETPLQPNQIHYVRTIYNSGTALLGILNDILDYSKIESGKMELENVEFNLEDLVDECVSVFTLRSSDRKVPLISLIEPGIPRIIHGDPTRLRQIIINLLSNAFKFTEHGTVRLNISREPDDTAPLTLRFEVTDTGIGLSDAQQAKLFKSFAQADASTSRKYGGTGLGLAICKQLSELMGGAIGVRSQQGVGSTFWFTISTQPGANQHSAQIEEVLKELRGKTLLIVDDTSEIVTVIKTMAKDWGMRVYSAHTGSGAIETVLLLTQENIAIDVALLDLELPDMNGIELSRCISQVSKHKPFPHLLITSARNVLRKTDLADSGITIALEKPIPASHLRKSLARALSGSSEHDFGFHAQKADDEDFSHLNILVAEDNQINQMVILSMLKRLNVKPDMVSDGAQAVEKFTSTDVPYDVILMDCEMPVMDGYEATRTLREQEKARGQRPVIFALSAHAMAEHIRKSLDSGMDDHITKPVSITSLKEALATVARRSAGKA